MHEMRVSSESLALPRRTRRMRHLTLVSLTALPFLLVVAGISAFSDGSGAATFEERIAADPLYHYFDGNKIEPKAGIYHGALPDKRSVSFVVRPDCGGLSNTEDAIYDLKIADNDFKTSKTCIWKTRYELEGHPLYYYETHFAGCEKSRNDPVRGGFFDCVTGRFATDTVVFGALPRPLESNNTSFKAYWVRPLP
jgi:hypothetical protein